MTPDAIDRRARELTEPITEALIAGFRELASEHLFYSAAFAARVASIVRELGEFDLPVAFGLVAESLSGGPRSGDAFEADFGEARERLLGGLSEMCQEIGEAVVRQHVDLALWELELDEEEG